MSGALAVIYMADRSWFWLKEQKQFDPWAFGFLNVFFLAIGLATVKRADKDLGFLNREQTDEWKGWMQSEFIYNAAWNLSLTRLFHHPSRHPHLSLLWGVESLGDIQSDPSPRRIVLVHDRLRAYNFLRKEGGLWLSPCGAGRHSSHSPPGEA